MMRSWLFHSLMALACWGLWAFFPKVAVRHTTPRNALVYEVVGCLIVALGVLISIHREFEFNVKGFVPSLLTGIAGTCGLLFFLHAIESGKLAVISTLTAVYPVVTILLAVIFLKEKISAVQWLGVLLAMVSVALMTHE